MKKMSAETSSLISTELKKKDFQQRSNLKVVELIKLEANLPVADDKVSHACKN